uniref:Riboflavin biosynthesis protein PYRD, chloroplastic n=1 Tax=Auxenochlorella protothecoides TaxID=3075 RepID=A0A1D1ZYK4_AUXPR
MPAFLVSGSAWGLQSSCALPAHTVPRPRPFSVSDDPHRGKRQHIIPRALNDAGSGVTSADREYMRLALDLASRGVGQTHPNPAVGCVLVRDSPAGPAVVGRGFHPRAGAPHAEVYALRGAGTRAAGATAYVTLEPCSHHGRTPPCAEALLAAGVKRVVVGVGDSNPLVGGAGVAALLAAGVQVAVGCEEAACTRINADFFARMEAARGGAT